MVLAATAGNEEGGDVDGEEGPRPAQTSAALISPPPEAGVDVDKDALFLFEPPPLFTGAALGSRRSIRSFMSFRPRYSGA